MNGLPRCRNERPKIRIDVPLFPALSTNSRARAIAWLRRVAPRFADRLASVYRRARRCRPVQESRVPSTDGLWRPFADAAGATPTELKLKLVIGVELARRRGAKIFELRPRRFYRRKMPEFVNLDRLSDDRRAWFVQKMNGEGEVPPRAIAELGPAIMFGHGYIATPDGEIPFESLANTSTVRAGHNYGLWRNDETAVWSGRPVETDTIVRGPATTLRNLGEFGWGHWLMELLPRVELYRAHPEFERLKIVVGQNKNRVFYESLLACGVAAENIVEVGLERPIGFERYICCSRVFENHGWIDPANADFLHAAGDRLLAAQPNGASWPKRIFLTRDDARHRKLLNQDAVAALLASSGFVATSMAGKTFAQHVELFAQAEAVVAVLGSGVANLVFARPGTPVVYLAPNRDYPLFFTDVALVAKQRLGIVFGESVSREYCGTSDFTVEVDAVRRCLVAMGLD